MKPKLKAVLTDDTEHANKILSALRANGGYCPCSLVNSEDTKCKCKEFRDQIKNGIEGSCHCGLYIAINSEKK